MYLEQKFESISFESIRKTAGKLQNDKHNKLAHFLLMRVASREFYSKSLQASFAGVIITCSNINKTISQRKT